MKETRTEPGPDVLAFARLVSVGGRPFVTFGPADPIWQGGEVRPLPSNTFARLRPPAHAEDVAIAAIKSGLEQHGASVRVEPREVAAAVVPKETKISEDVETPREVVLVLVEASTSRDKPALREICEEVMDRCGL